MTVEIKFLNFLWCCFLIIQLVVSVESVSDSVTVESVSVPVNADDSLIQSPQYDCNDDTLIIRGNFLNSSDIKLAECPTNHILQIRVYVVNTLYVDSDLILNGIEELQIFANTWNISRPVTFDLGGLNGTNQEPPQLKSEAGRPGNAGTNGGNFIGLAYEIINGDFLTVSLNGGSGGNGQDGTASDDMEVKLSDSSLNSGDSGWFSSEDVQRFYQKHFSDRGLDTDFNHWNDYTTFYEHFVQYEEANFRVRLHPRGCCGVNGMGGEGGLPGRSGKYYFKKMGPNIANGSPNFIAEYGNVGEMGKYAEACKTTALDVRINAKLAKATFAFIPLHYSFSSHLTVIDRVDSPKCDNKFVKSNSTIQGMVATKETKFALAIVGFKAFLLENMKNAGLTEVILQTYNSIDSNTDINDEYSVNEFVAEANELEEHFLELRKPIDLLSLYESLSKRIDRFEGSDASKDEKFALSIITSSLLSKKSESESESSLVVDIESFLKHIIEDINLKTRHAMFFQNLNINDVQLRNNINQFKFNVLRNSILVQYYRAVDAFKYTFFPFAADILEMYYQLPVSLTGDNINATISYAINNLESLSQRIQDVSHSYGNDVVLHSSCNINNSKRSFFVWKISEDRDKIQRLLTGEKVNFVADINKSKKQRNAVKFNEIDLILRISNETRNERLSHIESDELFSAFTARLQDALEYFELTLIHSGESIYRCDAHFYNITSEPQWMWFSFAKGKKYPLFRNGVYTKLRENRPLLSPFTSWEIQFQCLQPDNKRNCDFQKFQPFIELVDIELHGSGQYLNRNAAICTNSKLAKFYSVL